MFVRCLTSVFLAMMLSPVFCVAQEADGSSDAEAAAEAAEASPVTTSDPSVPTEDLEIMVKPLTKAELEVEAEAWFELLRAKARQISVMRLGVRKASEAQGSDDTAQVEDALQEVQQIKEKVDESAKQTEEEITEAAKEKTGVSDAENASDNSQDEGEDSDATTASSTEDAEASTQEDRSSSDGESTIVDAANLKTNLLEDINFLQDQRSALYDRLQVVLDSLETKGGDVESYRKYAAAVSTVELETTDAEAAWSAIVGWLGSKEGGQRWMWNFIKFALVLIIAYILARILGRTVNWLLERKIKMSQLAESLIAKTIRNVLMAIGFAVALTTLEIDVTPILAAIGATGLVVGLALQDSLSNVASGLMILINRPFDVGDVVSAGGTTGTVHQMNLVSTTFRTFDNQTIHVPNNEIWNNVITNVTANDTRRVDLEFGIGYDDDFDRAESIIKEVVQQHELVLDEPAPVVVTHALADSSVNIVCRPWAKTSDWWQVKTDVTREVKRRFDEAGISIPFPQRDIHVYHQTSPSDLSDTAEDPQHA